MRAWLSAPRLPNTERINLYVLLHVTAFQDGSFTIHGMADLEDVCTSLAFQQVM